MSEIQAGQLPDSGMEGAVGSCIGMQMRISLIINTFERAPALHALFRSIGLQTLQPDEIIVGDDGSGSETEEAIRSFVAEGMPVVHVWNSHDGFRVARARNSAIARAHGDYLILVDGDIVLHENFVQDHVDAMKIGHFVQGSRVCLDEEETSIILKDITYRPSIYKKGCGLRLHLVRSDLLNILTCRFGKLFRACNFAGWREDIIRINGFNEDFIGWGYEDNEFAMRLIHAGCKVIRLRFKANCYHLYHEPNHAGDIECNRSLYRQTLEEKRIRCSNGLDKHRISPLPQQTISSDGNYGKNTFVRSQL